MSYVPTIDHGTHGWESQERQYRHDPRRPGITYEFHTVDCPWIRHEAGAVVAVPTDFPVDCLIYRSNKGSVIGILNYYEHACPPWEDAGNVNVWTHPRRQRRGIATALVVEALRRWPIDVAKQGLTTDGAALANALARQGIVPPARAPLTERSRCGLHGDSTSSGRCATCDELGVRL